MNDGLEKISGKRVLLVEDEPAVRQTLKLLLCLDGNTVVEAANGREACHLFTPGEFDLVITDFSMPEMNGDELARTIKCLVPAQPILMITAFAEAVCGLDNPVDAVLEKPFSLPVLRRMLAAMLNPGPAPVRTPSPALARK